MFDLSAAPKSHLVNLVWAVNSIQQTEKKAGSTLLRVKKEVLVDVIQSFLDEEGDCYTLSDNGELVEVPKVADEPDKEISLNDLDFTKPVTIRDENGTVIASNEVQPEDTAERTTRSKVDEGAIITVTVETTPGRAGSNSYERRAALRSGMTVAEFLAAVGAKKGRRTISKCLRRGWITITSAN